MSDFAYSILKRRLSYCYID